MPIFDTPEPISATLELSVGNTRIVASDRTDTSVEVHPSDPAKDADVKLAERTRVEYVDGRLVVKAPKQFSPFGRSGSIEVTIEVPTGSHVRGDTGFGEFRSTGLLGECRFKTGFGDLRLDRTGPLHLRTGAGEITVNHAGGRTEATTGSGSVRIHGIDGATVVKNSNGDTWIGEVTGDLRANAANGDVAVRLAHADVAAKTALGSVRIDEIVRGTTVLESGAGEVEIGIRAGTSAWLDVRTSFGQVRNTLDAADAPEKSSETVSVRARTALGDVVIRRA
ncbi:DUF4097 family beta strand repeat-containing protein [Streptomyces sp. SID3343]|uniref:DUF4097 family beta strand repeat-containing protein n=1 Tax=Streptomyces sp. SID3343 TaxID=2690260 RepID=UPI0013697A0B|nr:DUF4097 family beta strand repeat-containing protein [Streptomyces sp. SID3343]MYV97724.1 DUF4097 family beta strand repeat protein [Streptomyces sp. SID3343]